MISGSRSSPGMQHDQRAGEQDEGVDREERAGVAETLVDPGFPAERLADHERRGERHDRGREHARAEQPDREQCLGQSARDGDQRLGRIGRRRDRPAGGPDGRRRRDHDEHGDDVGPDRPADRVGLLEPQLVHADALLGDGAVQVELHVRRDRRADDRDEQQELDRREIERRRDQCRPDRAPVRVRQDRRRDVGDEHDDHRQEDPLDRAVARLEDQGPDRDGDDRDHDVARHTEDLECRRGPGEFRDRVGEVGQQQDRHREGRRAHAEPVADQVRQSLAGDDAEAGRHLLDDGQDHDRDREEPQQVEAGLGADDAVGRDAAGVVAGDARDQARTHDREERDAASTAAEAAAQAQYAAVRAGARGSARWPAARVSPGCAPTRGARRRRQPAGSIVSIASSTVTIPTRRRRVDDRDGQQVVARDEGGHVVAVGQHLDRHRLVDHDLLDQRRRPGHDQVAQREHADQAPVVVGDVDVVDRLGVGLEFAQALDRVCSRQVRRHGHELGRHDPARHVLWVAQQLAELSGLVELHQGEDLLARRLGEVGDEVGGVVGASSPRGCRRRAPAPGPRGPRPGSRAPSPRSRRPRPRRRERRGCRPGRAGPAGR